MCSLEIPVEFIILTSEIKERQGLYWVLMTNSGEKANIASTKEAMSIDELHRCLGHVSYDQVKLLLAKGLVEGITLDKESEASVCESCEWAKGTRKAIVKAQDGDRCEAVGDEVHSDLWGPAPVETLGRKRYYISFTDDHSRLLSCNATWRDDRRSLLGVEIQTR